MSTKKGMRTWVAATDLHGDMQDKLVVEGLRRFVGDYKPQLRYFLGDVWDFRAWREGAGECEKRERIKVDFAMGMEFLEWYRPAGITLGNHDVRMWDQLLNGGPWADLADEYIGKFKKLCALLKCRVVPYEKRKVLTVGRLKMAHGFFDGENAAKRMAQTFGSVLFGHGHTIDVASVAAHGHVSVGRMIGGLVRKDMRYNRRNVSALRQRHGWAYGPLFANGTYQAFQAEVVGKQVVIAEGHRVMRLSATE